MRFKLSALLIIIIFMLARCGPQEEQFSNLDGIDFTAADAAPELSTRDPIRAHLARLFLVEQPTISVNPTLLKGIPTQTPGGILFWDTNKVGAVETREVIRTYSAKAKAAGEQPILFSMDYEGGDLELTPSGRMVPGIQRVKEGLTKLAHPVWLGKTVPKFGTEECALHGQIIAEELNSIGMNYPLGTVTDLARKLMALRGISSDPGTIAACMEALLESVTKQGDMIFVTKHFPGLGDVDGDTHAGVATSKAQTMLEMEPSLKPYRLILASLQKQNLEARLSVMSTHAVYPAVDPNHLSTESALVLTHLLRDALAFTGIRLSDAMWMGDYGKLGNSQLMPAYVSAILAGEDLLMIPGVKFAVALNYVRALYDGTLGQSDQQALESHMGQSFTLIRANFSSRVKEALARQTASLKTIRHSADVISAKNVLPTDLTSELRARYYEILRRTDPRWSRILPQTTPIPPQS